MYCSLQLQQFGSSVINEYFAACSFFVSASEMTYIVSGGSLNSTNWTELQLLSYV